MAKLIKDMYLVSKDEYDQLTNPDTTYTLMTKTSATNMVKHFLKKMKFTCWNDDPEITDPDDFCCSLCPVYDLPEELIAQTPLEKRENSKLLILNKTS
jgi:DNA gyrase inhibitor GyrI